MLSEEAWGRHAGRHHHCGEHCGEVWTAGEQVAGGAGGEWSVMEVRGKWTREEEIGGKWTGKEEEKGEDTSDSEALDVM